MGILRRSESRGKVLPQTLKEALEHIVENNSEKNSGIVKANGLNLETKPQEKNIICYENHPNDSRIKLMGEACQSLTSRIGTGGGNLPLVQECYNISTCDANGTRKDRPNGGIYITNAEYAQTISTKGLNIDSVVVESEAIAIDGDKIAKKERMGGSGFGINEDDVMYTQTVKDVHAVAYKRKNYSIVRKLMPIECERLMGFPDNYTRIKWRGKKEEDCPDAPRYKACGNSMCVNVMRWIGMRINLLRKINNNAKK